MMAEALRSIEISSFFVPEFRPARLATDWRDPICGKSE